MRVTTALLAGSLLVLPGCQMNERMTGTAGGAVGGAVLSAVMGASAGTVLVCAGAGALAGYLVGDYLADQRERGCYPAGGAQSPCALPAAEVQTLPPGPPSVATRMAAPAAASASYGARAAYEKGRVAPTVEEARAAYEESIRLDPTRPEPWNALALLSVAQGDRTAARAHLAKALALDPAYAPARHNLERLEQGY